MRTIETRPISSEYAGTHSFTGTPTEAPTRPHKVVSPNTVESGATQAHRVRSIHRPDTPVYVKPPGNGPEQKIVATSDIPDESTSTPQHRHERQQTGDQSPSNEQRAGRTERGIVPPIEPPTDHHDASAEQPEPKPPWKRLQELARIPPNPEQREEVGDLHIMGVTRLLEIHKEFIDTIPRPHGVQNNGVPLLAMEGEESIAIHASVDKIADEHSEIFILDFPAAPDDEKDTLYAYLKDSKGVVRKHVISKKIVKEKRQQIKPGEASQSVVVDIVHAENEKIAPYFELERELGVCDEVGLEEIQYVLGLAEKAIPLPRGAHELHAIHTRRLEGVPVESADAEEGAREFTTHIHNYLKKYGLDPDIPSDSTRMGGGIPDEPEGVRTAFAAGVKQGDGKPYAEVHYVDIPGGRLVILDYQVIGEELITTRSVGIYAGGELVDEQQTSARADVTEARYIRNFLHFPWARFDSRFWQT